MGCRFPTVTQVYPQVGYLMNKRDQEEIRMAVAVDCNAGRCAGPAGKVAEFCGAAGAYAKHEGSFLPELQAVGNGLVGHVAGKESGEVD